MLHKDQFLLLMHCITISVNFLLASFTYLKYKDTVRIFKSFCKFFLYFQQHDCQDAIRVFELSDWILQSATVFFQKFRKSESEFIGTNIVRYNQHFFILFIKMNNTKWYFLFFSKSKCWKRSLGIHTISIILLDIAENLHFLLQQRRKKMLNIGLLLLSINAIFSILELKVFFVDLTEIMHFSDFFVNNTSERLNQITSERLPLIKKLVIYTFIHIKTIQTQVRLYKIIQERIANIHQKVDNIISRSWQSFIPLHLLKIRSKKEFWSISFQSSKRIIIFGLINFWEKFLDTKEIRFESVRFFPYFLQKRKLILDFVGNQFFGNIKFRQLPILFLPQQIISLQSIPNHHLRFKIISQTKNTNLILGETINQFRTDGILPYDKNTKNLETGNLIDDFVIFLDEKIIISQHQILDLIWGNHHDLLFQKIKSRKHLFHFNK